MATRPAIRVRWSAATWVAAMLLLAPAVRGQQPNSPHIGFAYPAGGRQGTTVQIQVGGRFLEGATGVVASARGVRAEVVGYDKPLTQREITDLRDKAQELQKTANNPATRKEVADIRQRIGDSLRRNANPVLSEFVTLAVTIEPDAKPGLQQLRLATPLGLSNPVLFSVGQLPEVIEQDEVSIPEPTPNRAGGRAPNRAPNQALGEVPAPLPIPSDTAQAVTLPAIINGRIVPNDTRGGPGPLRQPNQYLPGDEDRYRFQARKGQELVVSVSARELIPYLADAVPGWFQATVALYDAGGHELAYDDDYRFQPDPVLHYRIPEDGEYTVEIKDALYRGREDFVYRIAVGELPFVTSIFPLGGPARSKTTVQATGWNLPTNTLTMDASDAEPGVYPLAMHRGELLSNRVPFALDNLRDTLEREPNNALKEAQKLTLPIIVNGRIQAAGDVDIYALSGRAGDQIVAEVVARRLGSPLDSVIELTDGAGRRLALNDDHTDKESGLITHQADSKIIFSLPASGTYFLRVGDIQRKGGSEYGYRLRVSAPQPDFKLRITPSEINASAGTSIPVAVHALRKDGFSGDIVLGLRGAPEGFTLSGGVVPSGQDQIRLTLNVPPVRLAEPISLSLEGRGMIQGKTVVRRAAPAEEMMQAFAYRHLVPADSLRLTVLARGGVRVPPRIVGDQVVKIPAGGTVRVRVAIPAVRAFEKIELALSEPPEGIELRDLVVTQAGAEFVLQADATKAKAGLRGNLIVTVSGERVPPPGGNQQGPAARRRLPLGTLPAISFEVITPQ